MLHPAGAIAIDVHQFATNAESFQTVRALFWTLFDSPA